MGLHRNEIDILVEEFLYLSSGHRPLIRRKLRALVKKALTSGMALYADGDPETPRLIYEKFGIKFKTETRMAVCSHWVDDSDPQNAMAEVMDLPRKCGKCGETFGGSFDEAR